MNQTDPKFAPTESPECVVGVVGLGVMGANLARNLAANLSQPVAVYDLNPDSGPALTANFPDLPLRSFPELGEFVASLTTPRVIMLMVPAGAPVDAVMDSLAPHLQAGDIVIDGGNSHYPDTQVRVQKWAREGIRFLGMGVSGGERGALLGPALMPGGDPGVWQVIQPLFEPIAARTEDGAPAVALVGSGASGHFTKMVHNGIEYGDLQLLAETYSLLRARGMTVSEVADTFQQWNTGQHQSYLLDAIAGVLRQEDSLGDGFLVEVVSDAAKGKGTGAWTVIAGAELGVSVSIIAEAFFARSASSARAQRSAWRGAAPLAGATANIPVDTVRDAYLTARLAAYQQGLHLLDEGSDHYGWDVSLGDAVATWRAGCIIRAGFLGDVLETYRQDPGQPSFITKEPFVDQVVAGMPALGEAVAAGADASVPLPAMGAALNYLVAARLPKQPTAVVQLLRDYFGSHTFERDDRPGAFHVSWGGDRTQTEM